MDFVTSIFGGGRDRDIPAPTRVTPPPVRVEPPEVKPRRKRRRSLATQLELSEPLIKEEKLGT